ADEHRARARALLAAVPTDLDLPNEVMAAEIRADRETVADALSEEESTAHASELTRLTAWRSRREQAAEVWGTYQAATEDLDPEMVSTRRDELRAAHLDFLGTWAYRGPDPLAALVSHRRLERLVGEVRDGIVAWPAFPSDPKAAVFRSGDVVSTLERGRAALDDAVRIRARLVDRIPSTTPQRDALVATAHRLKRDVRHARHRRDQLFDVDPDPFDRDIEDTPAEMLFQRVQSRADGAPESIIQDLDRDHYARAVRRAGAALVTYELLDEVASRIRAGELVTPKDAATIREERSAAIATVQHAWTKDPQRLSQELSWPATEALENAQYYLRQDSLDRRDVNRSYASYVRARLYAALVPAATEYVDAILNS
ncbi:MAG: hypothetical protein R3324_15095, partial [Halobacteriales archaeon]|nr:hypothetical protein [Halobacteriales archaeon]